MPETMPRLGVDSYRHLSGAEARAAGVAWWARYFGGSRDKDLTAAEVADAHAHGIDILPNYENQITDAGGGFAGGVNAAAVAVGQARAVAMPARNADGSRIAIYYSVDTAASAAAVSGYFQGIRSTGNGGYAVGGYGGTEMVQMLDEGLIGYWWQANAGSWSGHPSSSFATHPRAHIRQFVGPGPLRDTDRNLQVAADCGLWLAPRPAPPAAPAPKKRREPAMRVVQTETGAAYNLEGAGVAVHLAHPGDLPGALRDAGQVSPDPLSSDTLRNYEVRQDGKVTRLAG